MSKAAPLDSLPGFVARFVTPLLGGGPVEIGPPMSSADRERMLLDAGALLDSQLLHLRERAAQRLVAEPSLPEPGGHELSLWLGLYDVLALEDGRLALAVGDVAGHGVSSGLVMSMAKSALPSSLPRFIRLSASIMNTNTTLARGRFR